MRTIPNKDYQIQLYHTGGTTLKFKNFRLKLSAGRTDEIHLFTTSKSVVNPTDLVVLSVDDGLPYISLEVFDISAFDTTTTTTGKITKLEPDNEVFLQESEAEEYINLTPINIAKALYYSRI